MWHKHWTETIYLGKWPIFHAPVILPYILEDCLIDSVINGILDPCDEKIYHTKCMWVSDLYFMLQWFCLISWRLFDRGMLHWRYWFSATLSLTYKYICSSVTYILWCSDSAIFSILFDGQASFFGYWFWYAPLTCISWFSDFESFTYFCL